jgi:hypothetical protein
MAVHAVIRLPDCRWMISLLVKLRGKFKDFFRAELNTVAASFASILEDMDNALGNPYLFSIQRNSPKSHRFLPEKGVLT